MTGDILIILSLILFVLILYLFLLAPGKNRPALTAPFLGRHYAHRGLHQGSNIPENSLSAFAAAAAAGYGIELDVQLSSDNRLAVFHDFTLERMCGVPGRLIDFSMEELKKLRLSSSDEQIPELSEVLDRVSGVVPLLIELKSISLGGRLCEVLQETMAGYNGAYLIESFNPVMVRWYKKHAPHIARGQLSARLLHDGFHGAADFIQKLLISNLLSNFLARPDFIAYDYRDRDKWSFRLCRGLFHAPAFAWTVADETAYQEIKNDFNAVIFEGFNP